MRFTTNATSTVVLSAKFIHHINHSCKSMGKLINWNTKKKEFQVLRRHKNQEIHISNNYYNYKYFQCIQYTWILSISYLLKKMSLISMTQSVPSHHEAPKSWPRHHNLGDQRQGPSEGCFGCFVSGHATNHLMVDNPNTGKPELIGAVGVVNLHEWLIFMEHGEYNIPYMDSMGNGNIVQQWKKGPWLLRVYRGWRTTQFMWDFKMPFIYKDPY